MRSNRTRTYWGELNMLAALEAIIVVAVAMLGMGFFIESLISNTTTIVHFAGGLGAFAAAWAYGMFRAG